MIRLKLDKLEKCVKQINPHLEILRPSLIAENIFYIQYEQKHKHFMIYKHENDDIVYHESALMPSKLSTKQVTNLTYLIHEFELDDKYSERKHVEYNSDPYLSKLSWDFGYIDNRLFVDTFEDLDGTFSVYYKFHKFYTFNENKPDEIDTEKLAKYGMHNDKIARTTILILDFAEARRKMTVNMQAIANMHELMQNMLSSYIACKVNLRKKQHISLINWFKNKKHDNWQDLFKQFKQVNKICKKHFKPCDIKYFVTFLEFARKCDKYFEVLNVINSNQKLLILTNAIIELNNNYTNQSLYSGDIKLLQFIGQFNLECDKTYYKICKLLEPDVKLFLSQFKLCKPLPDWLSNSDRDKIINTFTDNVENTLQQVKSN